MTTPAPASDASPAHYPPYGAQGAPARDFTTCGGYDATGFPDSSGGTGTFSTDPLFGSLPGEQSTGAYDTTQWQTAQTLNYDPYAAQHHAAYDSGVYDTTAWTLPAQATGN